MRTVTPCYPLGRRPTYIRCFLQIRLLDCNSCGDICLRCILKRIFVTIVGPYHYYCKINTNSSAKTQCVTCTCIAGDTTLPVAGSVAEIFHVLSITTAAYVLTISTSLHTLFVWNYRHRTDVICVASNEETAAVGYLPIVKWLVGLVNMNHYLVHT